NTRGTGPLSLVARRKNKPSLRARPNRGVARLCKEDATRTGCAAAVASALHSKRRGTLRYSELPVVLLRSAVHRLRCGRYVAEPPDAQDHPGGLDEPTGNARSQ